MGDGEKRRVPHYYNSFLARKHAIRLLVKRQEIFLFFVAQEILYFSTLGNKSDKNNPAESLSKGESLKHYQADNKGTDIPKTILYDREQKQLQSSPQRNIQQIFDFHIVHDFYDKIF